MKIMKKWMAAFLLGICSLPNILSAQDEGTYIDNLGVQDSSYMEQDVIVDGVKSQGTNTTLIVIVVIIVVAALIYFISKKNRKK